MRDWNRLFIENAFHKSEERMQEKGKNLIHLLEQWSAYFCAKKILANMALLSLIMAEHLVKLVRYSSRMIAKKVSLSKSESAIQKAI